jgi:hypothetical protein
MMGGMVMVGGIVQNNPPVKLSQVTPVARLTSEYEVIVVPANGPKTLKELLDKFKANPGSVSWGGGSAGGTDHILAGSSRRRRRRAGEGQLRAFQGRRGSGRRDHRRPRDRRHSGLSRIRAAHQVGQDARARGVVAEGAWKASRRSRSRRRRRARQLARHLGRAGHHARATRRARERSCRPA